MSRRNPESLLSSGGSFLFAAQRKSGFRYWCRSARTAHSGHSPATSGAAVWPVEGNIRGNLCQLRNHLKDMLNVLNFALSLKAQSGLTPNENTCKTELQTLVWDTKRKKRSKTRYTSSAYQGAIFFLSTFGKMALFRDCSFRPPSLSLG